jgi:PEP-CTERM motif
MRRPYNGKHAVHAGLAAALLAGAGVAHADLVLLGQVDMQGTGLGNVNTLLTIQSPGSTTNETGAVGLSPGGAQFVTGNTLAINQTRTVTQSGASTASNLRLVFNAQEPGTAADNPITLNNLVLTIFSPTGTPLFTSGVLAGAPVNFSATQVGTGNAGFVFGLNAAQAAQAQAAAFTGAGFGNNVIGLSATASNATGGFETFFVSNTGGPGGLPPLVGPIPEPGTMAMLATGLLAMGGIARRRRKA